MPLIRGRAYGAAVPEVHAMDIAFLALLAVLVGLTAAYIMLCARLEDRK